MRKELIIGTMMSLVAVFFIFVVASSYRIKSNSIKRSNITPQTANINQSLTILEVAKHNTQSDCYMIISNKVYNITDYINSHPGGLGFARYCGQDATDAFNTKGGRGEGHSNYANQLLNNYFVANLK